jgi:hypothetical protein
MCPGIAAGLVAVRIVIAIVEADISSSTFDHYTPTCGETVRTIWGSPAKEPHRWLQRVANFVATGPPLNIDKIVAVDPLEHDPGRATRRPARRPDGTVAIVAPRASSSRPADSPLRSSRRPGRSHA